MTPELPARLMRLATASSVISLLLLLQAPRQAWAQSPTWGAQDSRTSNFLTDVHFVDAANGWVVGNDGTVLHTTDAGATWSSLDNVPNDSYGDFNSVHFLSRDVGWIGGYKSAARTMNGGLSWESFQDNARDSDTRNALFAMSATVIWQVGMQNWCNPCYPFLSQILYPQGDGIQVVSTHYGGPAMHSLKDVDFVGHENGWAVGYKVDGGTSSVIYRIYRVGSAFKFERRTFGAKLNSIDFVDQNNGWAVGDSGKILRTVDGGQNWVSIQNASNNNLLGVHFVDAANGWVVGVGGTILTTADGGETWSAEASGTTENLVDVFFSDSTRGYAVGGNGTLLHYRSGLPRPSPTPRPTLVPTPCPTRTPARPPAVPTLESVRGRAYMPSIFQPGISICP